MGTRRQFSQEFKVEVVKLRGRGLGQLSNGELLQFNEDRTHCTQGLPDARRSTGGGVRLHRAVLQPDSAAFDHRLCQPGKV